MRKLRTASKADRDIVDEALSLKQREPSLAADFLDEVDATLAEIVRHPLRCPTFLLPEVNLKVSLRWRQIGRFPHVAIFEVTHDEVVIYAVVHPHRDLEALLIERIGVQ
jgi:plasmid stabilization system protein ParE